jgi:predicted nucleic acid-binding protein
VRFWDSSAIIPLCLKERMSETVKRLIKADEDIVVWWGTRVECLSALSRRRREGALDNNSELKAKAILSALSEEWSEVQPSELVRQRAERLLAVHPLRSADAFQLAGALIWAQETPQGLEMVCLDQNLREAGHKEGFTLLPEE